ncbi:phospho-N-acetylmuramoyl-pentapeptide-transferase, partial [Candidatus Peregrinibacteria bacterium]|nr:phospho-N-acetylmuramoyl-pentapeptide-transferase [Candidatus Peregrinibacteria bacterium]
MTHIPFLLELFGYSVFAFFVTLVATPAFVRILQKWNIRKNIRDDSIDGKVAKVYRALHLGKEGTPTMGGVLIWGTTLGVILFSRFLSFIGVIEKSILQRGEVYLPIFTLLAMGILGGIDDFLNVRGIGKKRGLEALPKFLFTLLFATMGAVWFAFKLEYSSIHVPGVGDFEIGLWYIPLFILVIVSTANAVNITDGLYGLAGGLLIIAYATFVAIAYAQGFTFLAIFCGVIIGAIAAFLWHNIPPAKYFMGDTGSLALGATLGVIAMMIDSALL